MIYFAKSTPRAFLALVEAGAAPGQVPPWITRPAPAPKQSALLPVTSIERHKTSPEDPVPPVETGETLSLEAKDQVPPGTLGAPGVGAYEALPGAGCRARFGGIYDGAREKDARLQAMGIIRTDDGRHLQAATQPDGTPGFVVVNPAEIERGLFQDVGAKLSEAAVGDLNLHMRAVVRKIGLNPTVFMSYAWAVSDRGFQGDLGDFCNRAIKFYMKYGYGAQAAMVTGGATLEDVVGAQRMGINNGGRERIIPV